LLLNWWLASNKHPTGLDIGQIGLGFPCVVFWRVSFPANQIHQTTVTVLVVNNLLNDEFRFGGRHLQSCLRKSSKYAHDVMGTFGQKCEMRCKAPA
jgi:hypothetical protein